ncbi:MAG: transporter permease, partial [Marivirga sp.]|nr:transporter permease [Marivirga sp.]
EVGIKKTLGASRITLIRQFLTESMLMAFLALALAVLLSDLLITPFNHITGKDLNLTVDFPFVLPALGIAFLTGLFSGIYPALYLSRFSATEALKRKMFVVSGEGMARRGLVIFQFAISVILIISVVVVNRQMKFIQNKNLGYKRDHVIYFETPGMTSAFLSEIKDVSGVVNAGGGRLVAGGALGGTNDLHWEGKGSDDKTFFTSLWMCDGLIETLDMKMIEGHTFSDEFGSRDQIIFNEEAIKSMGLKDPVGKKVKFRGEERQIVGVIKDFHFESLYEKVKPCALLVAPIEYAPNVSVKILTGTEQETLRHLQDLYNDHYPGQTFDFKFMEDDYQRLYSSEQKVAGLTKYFAGLAILIS